MTRIAFLLLAAVLGSAFYLVHLQYRSRVLFTAVDRERASARRLETEREALEVQKRAQAAALRVDSAARKRLNMREAGPAITQYIVDKGSVNQVRADGARAADVSASAPVRRAP